MAATNQLHIGPGVAQFPSDAHIAAATLVDPIWNSGDTLLNFMMLNKLHADGSVAPNGSVALPTCLPPNLI